MPEWLWEWAAASSGSQIVMAAATLSGFRVQLRPEALCGVPHLSLRAVHGPHALSGS